MDFRTRIANQMGALLLANLEAVQATEDAQAALEGVKAVIVEKDDDIAQKVSTIADRDAQIAALMPAPAEPAPDVPAA